MPILSILGRAAGSGGLVDPLPTLAPAAGETSGGVRRLDHVTSPPALAAAVAAMSVHADHSADLAEAARTLVGARDDTAVHAYASAHDATAGLLRHFDTVVSVGDTAPFPRRGFGGASTTKVAAGISPAETHRGLASALRQVPVGTRTLVIVPAMFDDTGEVVHVTDLTDLSHRNRAAVLVLARSVPAHRGFDLTSCDADHLLLDAGCCYSPVRAAVLVSASDSPVVPAPAQAPSAAAIAAFATAIRELLRHRDAVVLHLTRLMTLAYKRLDSLPGVERHGRYSPGHDRVSVLSFRCAGPGPADVVGMLGEQGLDLAVRPSGLRLSVGLGTGVADLDRLALALRDIAVARAGRGSTSAFAS